MFFQAAANFPRIAQNRYRLTERAIFSPSVIPLFLTAIAILGLSYAVSTQLRTNSIYKTRGLDKSLNVLENDIAKKRAALLKSAQEPDQNISLMLQAMVEAGSAISFVHENEVFVDATRP